MKVVNRISALVYGIEVWLYGSKAIRSGGNWGFVKVELTTSAIDSPLDACPLYILDSFALTSAD